jgi:hypothetical protein
VHQGETVSSNVVTIALECCQLLMNNVVRKIARELGFTLDRTGKWAEIHDIRVNSIGGAKTESWQHFTPDSPFQKKSRERERAGEL